MLEFRHENRQKLFAQAYIGLRNQGFTQSLTGEENNSACKYRGTGNSKCAVGHLITDDKYNEMIEGRGAFNAGVMQILFGDDIVQRNGVPLSLDEACKYNFMLQVPSMKQERINGIKQAYGIDYNGDALLWGEFLMELQRTHDGSVTPSLMEDALAMFAEHHGLDIPA